MPNANSSPSEFVTDLTNPGLWIVPMSKWVSLSNYLCPVYGGNDEAKMLAQAIPKIVKGSGDESLISGINSTDYECVFKGQGKPSHISMIMHLIWYQRERFQAYKDLSGKTVFAKYFTNANPLQAMVEAKMFGYDCIGFVGRYLEEAGVFPKYVGMYPRHYLDRFFPVQKISDIDDGCVVVWINGSHIAVIDTKVKIDGGVATVNLCMSTSGGPQTSKGATLTHITSSTYLDFGPYGKEVDGKTVTEDERKEIQKKYQQSGSRGYREGLFFNITAGKPSFPNNGTVYVGRMPNLVTNWYNID